MGTWPCIRIIRRSWGCIATSRCVWRREKSGCKSKLAGLKKYFVANPGALFILSFQILLASAAVLLVEGNSGLANEVSVYAFYALVIGVAIQVGVVVREERKRTRTANSDHS